MANRRPINDEISAARKLLQNPYAYIEHLEGDADQPTVPKWVSRNASSQNPYASLPLWTETEETDTSGPVAVPQPRIRGEAAHPARARGVSKDQFRRSATRIFRQYIPRIEGQTLRSQHKNFIERNENQSSEMRYELLEHLRRYDVSNVTGITPHFNRERADLTEEKLRAIEALVFAQH